MQQPPVDITLLLPLVEYRKYIRGYASWSVQQLKEKLGCWPPNHTNNGRERSQSAFYPHIVHRILQNIDFSNWPLSASQQELSDLDINVFRLIIDIKCRPKHTAAMFRVMVGSSVVNDCPLMLRNGDIVFPTQCVKCQIPYWPWHLTVSDGQCMCGRCSGFAKIP